MLVALVKQSSGPVSPQDLRALLHKDAVYNAVGLAAFDLYDDIGKKHALKKYDHFVRNTSCFYTMCDFHKNTFFAISIMATNQFLHQKKV